MCMAHAIPLGVKVASGPQVMFPSVCYQDRSITYAVSKLSPLNPGYRYRRDSRSIQTNNSSKRESHKLIPRRCDTIPHHENHHKHHQLPVSQKTRLNETVTSREAEATHPFSMSRDINDFISSQIICTGIETINVAREIRPSVGAL